MTASEDNDKKGKGQQDRPDTLSDLLPLVPAVPDDEPIRPLLALLDEAAHAFNFYRQTLTLELESGGSPSSADRMGLQARVAKAVAIFQSHAHKLDRLHADVIARGGG